MVADRHVDAVTSRSHPPPCNARRPPGAEGAGDMAAPAGRAGLTLETVQRATDADVARLVVETALRDSGWELSSLRPDGVRLEPPTAYWSTYRVRARRDTRHGAEQRRLTLVARACFQPEDWQHYRASLIETYGGAPCRPIEGLGHPVLVDETQHAWWFFPVDPQLPMLPAA